MVEYIEALPITEAEELKRTIKDLFRQTCLLKVKCDPVTLIERDNPRYRICADHRAFISDYLSVIGCELLHDPQEHIFRLVGDGAAAEKFSETSTLLVLLIKLIYKDKIMGAGLNATVTNLAEIREYGKNTGLIDRKLKEQELREALTLMKTHQMIELPCAIGNLEDHTPIYLYSTVNLYCSSADINEIIKKYRDEVELLTISGEESESEAGEETIY